MQINIFRLQPFYLWLPSQYSICISWHKQRIDCTIHHWQRQSSSHLFCSAGSIGRLYLSIVRIKWTAIKCTLFFSHCSTEWVFWGRDFNCTYNPSEWINLAFRNRISAYVTPLECRLSLSIYLIPDEVSDNLSWTQKWHKTRYLNILRSSEIPLFSEKIINVADI